LVPGSTLSDTPGKLVRLYQAALAHRLVAFVVLLVSVVAAGRLAIRVRVDSSIEQIFPVHDPARAEYDRYRAVFPLDDARAVLTVEDPRVWTPAGLTGLKSLEDAFAGLESVAEVEGPTSVRDVTGNEEGIRLSPLFPRLDPTPEELAAAVRTARTDPLFAWNLAHPTRDVASILIRLRPDNARTDVGRRAFLAAADRIVRDQAPRWQRLLLTGIPVIRGRYIEMVQVDKNLLLPLSLLVVLVIIAVSFKSARAVVATVVTIVVALAWTFAAMALLDVPISVMTAFAPTILLVISITDTVHVLTDFDHRLRAGASRPAALAATMAAAAGPCLLTELTIASGFVSMGLINVTAIWEFAQVMTCGTMLTWLANVTVLPLVLSVGKAQPYPAGGAGPARVPPAMVGLWRRFLAGIERQVTLRPRVVVAGAVVLLGASGIGATRVRQVHFVFDDLRPRSRLFGDIRYAEEVYGGLVPLAIVLEPEAKEAPAYAALEPEAVRFLDRAEAFLRQARFPVRTTSSVATTLRKAHPLFAGDEKARADGGLPASRRLAVQEIILLDDGRQFQDLLTLDGKVATVLTRVPDMPAERVAAFLKEVEAWVQAARPQGYRAAVTGILAISNRVYELLLKGALTSFLAALLVTFLVFAFVLRSARLAVIGIIPNAAPILLMFGFMALLGIDLKPSTVLLFSMVLVIADDDTIQYLSRYRRRFLELDGRGVADPHGQAALELLRELGLPMFVTSTSVAAGFLLLCFSEFRATAQFGLIAGLTLFSAVFADLFLLPVIIRWWRPRLGRRSRAKPA
jgi:hypothetical protein